MMLLHFHLYDDKQCLILQRLDTGSPTNYHNSAHNRSLGNISLLLEGLNRQSWHGIAGALEEMSCTGLSPKSGIAAKRCLFSLVHQSDFPTNYSSSPICSIGIVISTAFR